MATKAPAKAIRTVSDNVSLESIVRLHSEINQLNVELKAKKAEFADETEALKASSFEDFRDDLGIKGDDDLPEIYGNHEFLTEDHLITVNYKMKTGGVTLKNIAGRPADEVLKSLVDPKDYKKHFKEQHSLMEDDAKLEEVADYRPDLVKRRLNVRALPDEAMDELYEKYPDAFTPYVPDEDAYIAEIEDANVETSVVTATGFISKIAALGDDTKYKLRNFIRKVLLENTTAAVKCGNRADA